MHEERRMILEMLSDKKITADEAAELLRAIGLTEPAAPGSAPPSTPPSPQQRQAGAAGESEGGRAGFDADRGPAAGRSILEDFLSRLDIDWTNLPFAFSGEAFRFDEQHQGEFEPGKPVTLDLVARNGRVEVFGTDEPGWRVVIRKKIRAQDEVRARQRAAEIASFTAGPSKLTFEEHATGLVNSGVSIEAYVPKHMISEVRARSSNGRVVVEGLRCQDLYGKTANGKVAVRDVVSGTADLSTANGGIAFEGSCGKLECSTANGQISVCPRPVADMQCSLHTSNGSIKVRAPQGPAIGYRIDARTGHGGLSVALSEFDVSQEEKQFGRRRLRGQSTGYAGKELKVDISARTTNGGIKVLPHAAGDDDCTGCNQGCDDGAERQTGKVSPQA